MTEEKLIDNATSILFSRFIATGFSAVHKPTRCRLNCLRMEILVSNRFVLRLQSFTYN